MRSALVSVIVPCYKQAQYLSDALDSVLSQTYKNWECIIVDDGSPDNTEDIAAKYCLSDSRFKYLKQENQGVSMARNNGIRASSGDYILPLDGDDKISPLYLEKAIAVMQSRPDCKLVYCYAEKFGAESGRLILPDYSYENMKWVNSIFCTAMYRRRDYNMTDGYNPNMTSGNEDWDFWLTFLNPEDKIIRINETLFYYRIKKKSRNQDLLQNSDEMKKALVQMCRNHQRLYLPELENIIWLHARSYDADFYEEENKALQNKLSAVLSSNSYKLGRLLSFPIRFVKDFLLKSR